jgi:hypothetical protein
METGNESDGRGSFPAGARFFSFRQRPDRLSPGIKRQGREADPHLHLVPMRRTMALYLHSLIHLRGVMLQKAREQL